MFSCEIQMPESPSWIFLVILLDMEGTLSYRHSSGGIAEILIHHRPSQLNIINHSHSSIHRITVTGEFSFIF